MCDKSCELENAWSDLKRKLDYYFSRILVKPLAPPEHVYFSLTNRCNLRCKMCSIPLSPSREEDEMTEVQCKSIIDEIAGLNIQHLIFSGGEPLLRKDIFRLVRHAVARQIKMVDIITNGLLITDTVAKELVSCGLNHLTVSIDGLGEKGDFIRGMGASQKAMQAIDCVNRYKKGNKLPTVGINFTIMDCNIDQILPMIDVARGKGCNIVVLQPMMSDNTNMQDRQKNELWVRAENIPKLEGILNEVIRLKRTFFDFSIHVNDKILELIPAYFSGKQLDKSLKCYEGLVRIVLTCGGDLWTCQGMYGNIRGGGMKRCWFSAEARNVRRKVKLCTTHCLQSCVQLVDLVDVYADVKSFLQKAQQDRSGKEYSRKLIASLHEYKRILSNKYISSFLKRIINPRERISENESKLEINRISRVIREIKKSLAPEL